MKVTRPKKNAAALLTVGEIDRIVAEIADHQSTIDGMQGDIDARLRALDAAKAALAAEAQPHLDRITEAQRDVRVSLEERWLVVEQWAEAHKDDHFAEPRSLKLLRATIGFRLSPPKVSAIKGWTLERCALAAQSLWGNLYLKAPVLNREAIIDAREELRDRLPEAGLRVTQEDVFFIDVDATGSAAVGKEAV